MTSNDITFKLLADDNIIEYLDLIKHLSNTIERDNITNFMNYYKIMELYPFVQIWIAQEISSKKIVGCGTILIEPKFIHKCGSVAHIEDICILPEYRSKGYGKMIIQLLINISKENGCYKLILDCNDKNVSFYEKCGFKETNKQMSIYFEQNIQSK
jgi:glucosamine-phosphate N-acetyltransferase